VSTKTLTIDRVPLPPGFRMFILPEYRLVTPSYSVELSRSHGAIVSALLANYERYVLKSDIEDILWGHLEDGGPETASSTINVMLCHIRTKFSSIGIDVKFKNNRWSRQVRAIRASGLRECRPVGDANNPIRLKALRDRQSPNPARGLPDIEKETMPPPVEKPRPEPRYSYVERPRLQAAWTHNARAEAYFGQEGPKRPSADIGLDAQKGRMIK